MSDTDYRYCPHCRTELGAVERGGQTRLACPQCSFVHWRNPVPVVAAVVERAGRVVLVHSIGRPSHWYGLVAGFLERGEHPADAVLREVAEELGLDRAPREHDRNLSVRAAQSSDLRVSRARRPTDRSRSPRTSSTTTRKCPSRRSGRGGKAPDRRCATGSSRAASTRRSSTSARRSSFECAR